MSYSDEYYTYHKQKKWTPEEPDSYNYAKCGKKILGRQIDRHQFETKKNPSNCHRCNN